MDIISRLEAKSKGLKRYFTGKACKYGHVDERRTDNGRCVSCASDWSKRWAKENPNYYSEYYEDNKEFISKRHKNRYLSDPDVFLKRGKKYRSQNKDKVRAKTINRRASMRNAPGTHTADDIALILEEQNFTCPYCLADLADGYHVDHYMPLALGGSNWPDNLQCTCPTCNMRKGAKHPSDWHKELGFFA